MPRPSQNLCASSSTHLMSASGIIPYPVPWAQQCRHTVGQPATSMHRYSSVTGPGSAMSSPHRARLPLGSEGLAGIDLSYLKAEHA
jgi:hypothetical protein